MYKNCPICEVFTQNDSIKYCWRHGELMKEKNLTCECGYESAPSDSYCESCGKKRETELIR